MWYNLFVMFLVSAVISTAVAMIIEGIFYFISWIDRMKSGSPE
jgi:hypothetical protein